MALRYWLLVVFLGAVFGSSFFFNEILLEELAPLTIAAGRVSLGALGAWTIVAAMGRLRSVARAQAGWILIHGTIAFATPFTILAIAQQFTTGGTAGIANALTPVMVVIISHVWPGGERATFLKTIGVLLGFVGIVAMALPTLGRDGSVEFWAIIFLLLAPLSYGIASNSVRWFRDLDTFFVTAAALTGASLILVPLALLIDGVPVIQSAKTWASLLFLGLLITGAAFMGIFWLIKTVGATVSSTATLIAPVSAVILGGLFLGEVFTRHHALGMALIFAGLMLIDGRLVRRLRRPSAT